MAMSRQNYATGNAERIAAQARSYVRNELKAGPVISVDQVTELARMIAAIEKDWRVPATIRGALKQGIWDEFTIRRVPAVLVSAPEAGDRRKRLRI